MNPTKTLIAEAVSRFAFQETPAWENLKASDISVELDHIETDTASITTVDCLFDGQATIILKDARALQALVFGRFDGRRAEVERIVLAA
jgi:hypothetical protein